MSTTHGTNPPPSSYKHILKYTSLFGMVQVLNIVLSIIRNKCIALFLGPVGMGLMDIYNKAAEFVGNTTNFGLSMTGVRVIAECYATGQRAALRYHICLLRSWALLSACLAAVTCLVFSPALSYFTFSDLQHTWAFMLLAPMAFMLTLTGAELAILKGLRRLRRIAVVSLCSAVSLLLLTLVLIALCGIWSILPVLLSSTACMLVYQLWATHDIAPWRVVLRSRRFLRQGMPMIRLGIAFNLAAIMTSGVEMAIRAFIAQQGSVAMVGMYAAGFMITVAYARLIFVAADADYYPRLSALLPSDVLGQNVLVNKQIEVYVLLMGPFLVFFLLFLPTLIPLLYDDTYTQAIPMTIAASMYMYFKAMVTPIAYLSLARGDARMYFCMELIYDVVLLIAILALFSTFGLAGAGLALSVANGADLFFVWIIYARRYGYRMDRRTLVLALWQGILVLGMMALAWGYPTGYLRYLLGLILLLCALYHTYHNISHELPLWTTLRTKLKRRKSP